MNKIRFLSRLKFNRWYSENTIENYKLCLNQFDKFLKEKRWRSINECEKICLLDIETFYQWELRKWKKTKTCNLYLSWIKSYLKYCAILWKNVMNTDSIIRWKEADNKIESLNDEDSKKLIEYFKNLYSINKRKNIIYKRNFCMVWLLFYTWLRISELRNLKRNQISEYMQIIWKWNKLRWINLYEEDLEVVNDYLNLRKDKYEDLFISFDKNNYWKKLSKNIMERIIKEWWEKAWLSERVRPHKLRHTFATNLLRNWVKLEYIQKLLWHSSILTTQIYLTVQNNEIRESQSKMKRF